jgi:AcrR family transcriptional regulator
MALIDMRSRILEVASRLFEERGIHGSGVDTIIAEAGVAKATLYKHFASKDSLINAFLRSKADAFYEWLRSGLINRDLKPSEQLIHICNLLEQWILTPDFKGLPFHIASVEFPDPAHPVHQFSASLALELQQYLTQIAAEAGVQDPKALCQQLTMIFEGAALIERLSPGSGAASRAKHAAVILVRAALVKTAATV